TLSPLDSGFAVAWSEQAADIIGHLAILRFDDTRECGPTALPATGDLTVVELGGRRVGVSTPDRMRVEAFEVSPDCAIVGDRVRLDEDSSFGVDSPFVAGSLAVWVWTPFQGYDLHARTFGIGCP